MQEKSGAAAGRYSAVLSFRCPNKWRISKGESICLRIYPGLCGHPVELSDAGMERAGKIYGFSCNIGVSGFKSACNCSGIYPYADRATAFEYGSL